MNEFREESLGPPYTLGISSDYCGSAPQLRDSTHEVGRGYFRPTSCHFLLIFKYWNQFGCYLIDQGTIVLSFGQLIKKICSYFLGYMWYDVYHFFSFILIC